MRLTFPNGEHPDLIASAGSLDIGADEHNAVAVAHGGLRPRHARILMDVQRGTVLELLDGAGTAHVNGRPVRQRAMLRLGDVLSLGELQILIKPDHDGDIDEAVPGPPAPVDGAQQLAASRVVLRGVGGALFGRSFPLVRSLVLGSGSEADIRLDDPSLAARHAQLENHGDRVVLRHLDGGEATVVNGVAVKDAVLHPGDQIAIDHHRFVLEAPGLPPRGSEDFDPGRRSGPVTQTMRAVRADDLPPAPGAQQAEASGSGGGRLGWLILAALAIMLAIAALVVYGPGLSG